MTFRLPFLSLLAIAALILFMLLGWVGGETYPLDVAAIRSAMAWRMAHPQETGWLIFYTHLGGGPALLTMTTAGAALLWWKQERLRAGGLVAAVIAVRIGIELIKLGVDRPRPSFDAHPVMTFSQSFPSGHAGNGMATFLALALFVAPDRWRGTAVAVAVPAALLMGVTRPMLGVHWPSDVLGGWIFGSAVVLLVWAWVRSRTSRNGA